MNLKTSLIVLFLVLTLFVYGCASNDPVVQTPDISEQTGEVTNDLSDFDQIDQDLGQLEDINVDELDF
nr:hypothetical protein [Nanoarchaeum sp.]